MSVRPKAVAFSNLREAISVLKWCQAVSGPRFVKANVIADTL
jgi:hypothetical protein